MNEKVFVWLLTTALLATVPAEAQQAKKLYRIGVLTNARHTTSKVVSLWEAFRYTLGERGWIEGQNIITEYRWAEGQVERFPSLELVGLKVDVIVAAMLVLQSFVLNSQRNRLWTSRSRAGSRRYTTRLNGWKTGDS
jgi:hypothetical protein